MFLSRSERQSEPRGEIAEAGHARLELVPDSGKQARAADLPFVLCKHA